MVTETTTMATLLEDLNPEQLQAVTSDAKQMLVLAGAGSGKTRVLVTRIIHFLVERAIPPRQIMAVTFTNKAAKEMKGRIQADAPSDAGMWVGTFHGICHRILRQHPEQAGLPENFQIIDTDDQKRLFKRILQELNIAPTDNLDPKRIIGFVSRCKDEGQSSADIQFDGTPDFIALQQIYATYEQHCQRSGLVDFGDIILKVVQLFEKHDALLAHYRARFTHILVDEFQDTNAIQYRWLCLLCSPEQHLTVVGDDDQSIYGWRGAKIENIRRLKEDYPALDVVRLEQNYRSTQVILEAANHLISNNTGRMGKNLWTSHTSGEKIQIHAAFDEQDEARHIVRTLEAWRMIGRSWDEMAILYRSNAQSRVLEQALRYSQIPYKIYGGLRFFERAEIKDVLAYLRLSENRSDDAAFDRVVNLPPRGLGDKTLAAIKAMAAEQACPLWDAARSYQETCSTRVASALGQFFDLVGDLSDKSGVVDTTQYLFHQGGFLNYLQQKKGERAQTQLENVKELLIALEQYSQVFSGEPSEERQSFLSDMALDVGEETTSEEEEGPTISLMTLHAAKGLEYPFVVITGLEEGLFPHHQSLYDAEKCEEERRLCYVGLTRAKERLLLTFASRRAFSSRTSSNKPSRFLKELPEKTLDTPFVKGEVSPSRSAMRPLRYGAAPVSPSHTRNQPVQTKAVEQTPWKIGALVSHPKFGTGTIVSTEGSGAQARIQVMFETAGAKWLVLSFAKLTLIA